MRLNESKTKKMKKRKKEIKIGHFSEIFSVTFVPFLKPFSITERCLIPF